MRRINTLMLLASSLSGILLLYIYNMQFNAYDKYQELAQKNRIAKKPIPAQRGIIYDRNQLVLAENIPSLNTYITPKNCDDVTAALEFIASFTELSKQDRRKFNFKLTHKHKFDTIMVKADLSDVEAAQIYSHLPAMPCVSVHESLNRRYHYAPALANVIGYIKGDEFENKGALGAESTFNAILTGTPGYYQYEVDAARRPVRLISETQPIKGYDIKLTIDAKLQEFIYQAFGNELGAAVAINPANGEILAMVSHPSVDNNLFLHSIASKTYQAILNDPNLPMLDRATKGQFAPGSTIKPFIALAALEGNYITEDFSVIDDLGYFIAPHTNHKYRDWLRTSGGHGRVDIEQSLAYSCDVFYYKLSMLLGMKKITPWLHSFGFGQNLTRDIPYAAKGALSTPEWKKRNIHKPWYTGDTIMSYIGQGYMLTTPLQLATATTIMTNQGKLVEPHILQSVAAKNLTVSYPKSSAKVTEQKYSISDRALAKITAGMERVIRDQGNWTTGWRFGRPDYSVAAKTGTAQVVHDNRKSGQRSWQKNLRDNSWFIAFSPSKKPKIVLAILVEHSPEASKIARKIMDYAKLHQII